MISTLHREGQSTYTVMDNKHTNSEDNIRKKSKIDMEPMMSFDHLGCKYTSFRKVFGISQWSNLGNQWRNDNFVTCSINIDAMLTFGQSLVPNFKYTTDNIHGDSAFPFPNKVLDYLEKTG